MQKLSSSLLASTVALNRKNKKISQSRLSELTGINRALISRIESQDFVPSVDQLLALSNALGFQISDVLQPAAPKINNTISPLPAPDTSVSHLPYSCRSTTRLQL